MALATGRRGDWWVENLLRPALIAGMTACIAAPLALFLEWILGDWGGAYFLYFVFFASLEGILGERVLRKRRISGWAYLVSRVAELLLLLLALKVLNYVPQGFDLFLAEAATWVSTPESFVTDLDLFTGMMFLPLWAESLYVARMAAEIELDTGRLGPPPDRSSAEYYMWLTEPSVVRDRQQSLGWLGDAFLWGGIVLLGGATLIHAFVSSAEALAIPILLYFALGVALLTQAQFSVRSAGWQVQGIPVQPGIGRRWLVWALVFVVGVALGALLLPTGYAMGPIQALWGALGLLIRLLVFGFTMIFFLLSMLLALFMPSVEPIEQPVLPLEPIPPALPGPEAVPLPWLETLLSTLFWLVILAIVVYALVRFVRERFGWLEPAEGAQSGWRGRFFTWLRNVWRRWRGWQEEARLRRARRRAETARAGPGKERFRFLSLRGLSPRDLVRYFYASAARRAAQAGQPRRPGQTPYEYQRSLDGHFPDLEPDLTGLTEAFVQARYSRRQVEKDEAERVKPLWQRIKSALRRCRPPRT